MKTRDFYYKIYKFGSYSKRKIEKLYSQLPLSRKFRIDAVSEPVYREFLIVEYFLVIKELKRTSEQDFSYNVARKPYFENSELNFNISHSKNILIVVFSKKQVGVDIQHILHFDDKIARQICNDEEYKFCKSKNCDYELTKLWTRKESVVKMFGRSLYEDTKNILTKNSNLKIFTINKRKYFISICTSSEVAI